MRHRVRDEKTTEFYNWSGYAVTGSTGSVTDVKASWVVPSVTCSGTSADGPNVYASFWAGIDGWNSNTVEQIGTDSDCQSPQGALNTPTYYAWFEFYPQDAYYIGNPDNSFSGYVVHPLDVISAEVKFTGSSAARGRRSGTPQFTVTITDETRNWTFTTSSSVSGAEQSSAEWIAETPYGCRTTSQFCYLPDFAVADYGAQDASIPKVVTESATVNGVTAALGGFGNSVQQAVMVSDPSGTTMAQPSILLAPNEDGGDTSFTVTWENAGP